MEDIQLEQHIIYAYLTNMSGKQQFQKVVLVCSMQLTHRRPVAGWGSESMQNMHQVYDW
jgi:hypothetical protein